MSIKQYINQSLKTKQVMKPAMIKSLELLTKTSLELREHLKTELMNNPVLEVEEMEGEPLEENNNTEKDEIEEKPEEEIQSEEYEKTLQEAEELSEILDYWNEEYSGISKRGEYYEKPDAEKYVKYTEDYKEKINIQIDIRNDLSEDEKNFAYDMIESMDSYGYLPEDYDIYEECRHFNLSNIQADKVHDVVLNLEPKGLAARNLKESLLAQLDKNLKEYEYIKKIIEEYFDDLMHRRYKKIASAMGVTIEMVLYWKEIISKLDPKPGLRIQHSEKDYVNPEVVIKKIDDKFEIIIKDFNFPRIKISRNYSKFLQVKKNKGQIDKDALDYVREKINSAKFLIKSIYLRNKTLKDVVREIIKFQSDFFYEKSKALKPMVYADIAEKLGVNESTISRVVRKKYVDTPFGIIALKDFFTSKAGKDDNYNSISRQNVEIYIKELIEKEDKSNPLTDKQITSILKEKGLNVSRRVVAKYRQQLGYLNSHLRKK